MTGAGGCCTGAGFLATVDFFTAGLATEAGVVVGAVVLASRTGGVEVETAGVEVAATGVVVASAGVVVAVDIVDVDTPRTAPVPLVVLGFENE